MLWKKQSIVRGLGKKSNRRDRLPFSIEETVSLLEVSLFGRAISEYRFAGGEVVNQVDFMGEPGQKP